MGINGLLPVLKPITQAKHISAYAGNSVAVDGYSWLHKGVYACSTELCLGQPTTKHIQFCINRVELLRRHGVEPVLVFDGGKLPSKDQEESNRSRCGANV
jgi:exonuclease-1